MPLPQVFLFPFPSVLSLLNCGARTLICLLFCLELGLKLLKLDWKLVRQGNKPCVLLLQELERFLLLFNVCGKQRRVTANHSKAHAHSPKMQPGMDQTKAASARQD